MAEETLKELREKYKNEKTRADIFMKEYHKYSNKNSRKLSVIFILSLLLLSAIFILPNIGKSIDKEQFCKDKISKYFPEYKDGEIGYIVSYKCMVTYKEGVDLKRDGLLLSNSETRTKIFNIVNEKDKEYITSKDGNEFLVFLGGILLLGAMMFSFGLMMEILNDR